MAGLTLPSGLKWWCVWYWHSVLRRYGPWLSLTRGLFGQLTEKPTGSVPYRKYFLSGWACHHLETANRHIFIIWCQHANIVLTSTIHNAQNGSFIKSTPPAPANKTAEIVSSGQIKNNVVAHRPLVVPYAQLRTSESGSLKLVSILSWVRPWLAMRSVWSLR